jgi:hypothetical protein
LQLAVRFVLSVAVPLTVMMVLAVTVRLLWVWRRRDHGDQQW